MGNSTISLLQMMGMAGIDKNVFVSHVHEDDIEVGWLIADLKKRGYFARDYSITRDKDNNARSPDYIKWQKLAPRIDRASALLVIISPETENSEWVEWEVDYAMRHDKKIVGIWARGSTGISPPRFLLHRDIAILNWDIDALIAELER